MNERLPRAAAVATLALTGALATIPLVITGASADGNGSHTGQTKVAIEHRERQTAGSGLSKAQIEHGEVSGRVASSGAAPSTTRSDSSDAPSSSGNAAAWQLAVSAALGGAVTGAVFVGARQAALHRSGARGVAT